MIQNKPAGTPENKAIVLFSGGQDSTTCLGWALERYDQVETIGFDYGQRHSVELECRQKVIQAMREFNPAWDAKLGPDWMIDMRSLGQIADCALTDERQIAFEQSGLPNTFVPGRNLLFFTYASIIAHRRGASVLVGGMCEADFSGYPDCRDNTLKSLQVTLSLGMAENFVIETPLMWLTKAQAWSLAEQVGGKAFVDLVCHKTHTCYMGDHETHHEWGYGCGQCPACQLRAQGWAEYQSHHP